MRMEAIEKNKLKIHGLFLAAGSSERMRQNKLELPFRDTNLGSYSLRSCLASNINQTHVVMKEKKLNRWINSQLYTYPFHKKWSSVSCPHAKLGLSYSIKCGLKEAISKQADAVIIILADQPFVSKEMINKLIEEYVLINTNPSGDDHFIASSYDGLLRPPILFTKKAFPYLLQLEGDQGARQIIRQSVDFKGRTIDFDREDWFIDIDTWEDYIKMFTSRNRN